MTERNTDSAQGAHDSARSRAAAYSAAHARAPVTAPDQGKVYSRSPRPDGTEFRVSEHVYEGHAFIRLGPWQRGEGDAWWPCKAKGTTVKLRELGDVVTALCDAMDVAR